MIDKLDIDYTVRRMIEKAVFEISEIDEPQSAVETLEEIIKILDGDEQIASDYWSFEHYCRPIETFTEDDLMLLKRLEIIKE
jgi:hypothetical protein